MSVPEQSNQVEGQTEIERQPPVLRAVPSVSRATAIKPQRVFELPLDPDVIADYLSGEHVALEPSEPRPPPARRPTLALVAAGIALAVFLVSIWIALR